MPGTHPPAPFAGRERGPWSPGDPQFKVRQRGRRGLGQRRAWRLRSRFGPLRGVQDAVTAISLSRCGWMPAAETRRPIGWRFRDRPSSTFPRKRASRDDPIRLDRALTRINDFLLLIDVVPPACSGRGMMAVIVRTEIRQQERGGLLPNPALQAVDHLGRSAPSVARR